MIKDARVRKEHELAAWLGVPRSLLLHAGLHDVREKTLGAAVTARNVHFLPTGLTAYQSQLFADSWNDAIDGKHLPTMCRLLQRCAMMEETPAGALAKLAHARRLRQDTGEAAQGVDFLSLVLRQDEQKFVRDYSAAAEIAFVRQYVQKGMIVTPIREADPKIKRADYDLKARADFSHRLIGRWGHAEVKMIHLRPSGRLPSGASQKHVFQALERAERQLAVSMSRVNGPDKPTPIVTCYWWSGWRESVEMALKTGARAHGSRSLSAERELMAHMITQMQQRASGAVRVHFGFLAHDRLEPVGDVLPIITPNTGRSA